MAFKNPAGINPGIGKFYSPTEGPPGYRPFFNTFKIAILPFHPITANNTDEIIFFPAALNNYFEG
jgi:hypothetical protein